jgi:hypothetical protein
MAGRKLATGLALLFAAAGPAAAQENPIDFLKRLIEPPAKAIGQTFRPTKAPDLAATASAAAGPGVAVPLPRIRPAHEDAVAAVAAPLTESYPPAAVAEADREDVPVPLLGFAPPAGPSPFDALIPTPRSRPDLRQMAALPPLIEPAPAAKSTCGAALAMIGVKALPLAPIAEGGGCGVAQPVAVSSFEDGAVDLTEKAIIDCRLAEKLADWLANTVQPAAKATLGGRVSVMRVAASYDCRNRNGQADAKLSEHAKGNAIDIAAFRVNGEWFAVGKASGDGQRFLSTVRKSACGPFTTVLGPGSDAYHGDHFHLDQAKRRAAGPSKGLYCH